VLKDLTSEALNDKAEANAEVRKQLMNGIVTAWLASDTRDIPSSLDAEPTGVIELLQDALKADTK
jgi:hypothetical protein